MGHTACNKSLGTCCQSCRNLRCLKKPGDSFERVAGQYNSIWLPGLLKAQIIRILVIKVELNIIMQSIGFSSVASPMCTIYIICTVQYNTLVG